ncbi:molybdopterin molybdotransferase MoeA [Cyanobium sp. ATX 6F1]|uniref:molybdopterin molybdotransferase MoeA n=1 Tax=Cyanobium sp. ATX 6F1 TaxID=2823702 RepID=UPI0020CC984D|nr:molybdopterin molybdotransferase MoeA [Cyanobium sp. ATX 6F1]
MSPSSAPAEPFPAEGLPLEEARRLILEALQPLGGSENLPLAEVLGRVSAEPALAREAVPGFRASIMDGYALADAGVPELGQSWRLVGRSAPGAPYEGVLAAGEAIRILTGAPLPEGGNRVLPQELVEREESSLLRLGRPAGPNPWIRAADEEASAGQELLAAGERLGVADLARLASCGVGELAVRPRPRIGLLISGDELVAPGKLRAPGCIWESNGTLLEALLARLGYGVSERRVEADDPGALRQALIELAAGCDVVVSTGGVSAGDSDWMRALVAELGEVAFWKLFLKPGRPFAWGRVQDRPFFGLPGNPVAAAITALQLLWPALQRLEGAEIKLLPRLKVHLAADLNRGPGRPELARARLQVGADGALLALVEGSQASSRLGSLQGADLLLEIPAEAGNLAAGTELWAQLLRLPIL